MKKTILTTALAFAAMVSCTKLDYFEEGKTMTLNVTYGIPATKITSHLDTLTRNISLLWQKKDIIKVTVGGKSALFTLVSGEGTSTAKFKGKMPATGDTCDIQYPANDPIITSQSYSEAEAIPHDKMLLKATGCKMADKKHFLQSQNSVLRLNFYGTSQNIGKIVVTNHSNSIAYTLTISGGVTLPTTSDKAKPFFIVVPAGNYNFSAEVFDNAATPTSICSFSTTSAQDFTNGKIHNMGTKKIEKNIALTGDFSVSSSSKVNFSPGNLYYTGSEFKFEADQLSYSSTASTTGLFLWVRNNGNINADISSVISRWAPYPARMHDVFFTNSIQTGPRIDFTVEGEKGKWRTLSKDEWVYILNTRSGDNAPDINGTVDCRYAEVRVNGKCGMLLFPDTFFWPSDVSSKPSTFNTCHSDWNSVDYTIAEFTLLENAGCIFLPAAGYRYESSLSNVGSEGNYWSSTPSTPDYTSDAYYLYFNNSAVSPENHCKPFYGQSIRLVCASPLPFD